MTEQDKKLQLPLLFIRLSIFLVTFMWTIDKFINPGHATGRDNKTSHKGMGTSESDWEKFIGHVNATLDKFQLPQQERSDVTGFIESTKADIVELCSTQTLPTKNGPSGPFSL